MLNKAALIHIRMSHVVYTPKKLLRLLRTPDIKGLLGFRHGEDTAWGFVNESRLIAINVTDWRLINEAHKRIS